MATIILRPKKKKKGSNLKIFCNLKMFIKDPDVHRSLQLSLRDSWTQVQIWTKMLCCNNETLQVALLASVHTMPFFSSLSLFCQSSLKLLTEMERATRSNFSHMCKKKKRKNWCTCSYDFVLVPPDTKNEFWERSRGLTPFQTGHEECIKKMNE